MFLCGAAWTHSSELALDEARRMADSEEDRRRTAEGKASTYLLFAGALIPLLTYLETSVWEGKIGTAPKWLSTSILLLAVSYLMGAGVWAFRTVSVGTFHRLDVADLVRIWSSEEPAKELIRETLVAARMNRDEINKKVSCIKMAHLFMTRAFLAFGMLVAIEAVWEIGHSLPFKFVLTIERTDPAIQVKPEAIGTAKAK